MNAYHESWEPLFSQYDFDIDALYEDKNEVYPKKEHIFRVFEMNVKDELEWSSNKSSDIAAMEL